MAIVIACVQAAPVFADKSANLELMDQLLREAVAQTQAKLVVFPEAFVTGYCFDSLAEAAKVAEQPEHESAKTISATCRELGCHVVYGTLERSGEKVYNAAVLTGPDGWIATYRKTHLPYLGVDRFTAHGTDPFVVHDIGGLRVGMLICYDATFPEASRALALAGADLIVLPTNWPPGAETTADHVIPARAIENHVYYLAVNRVGTEAGFKFIGKSSIIDPFGRIKAQADHTEQAILSAEIDPKWAREKRIVRVPDRHIIDRFGDRRPELYGGLIEPVAQPTPRR